ncbi:MAG TPA: ABC transporter substrate-binding protein [Acidimicrobiales bacterium]|nr:ABC transporter substrate-binding protein [Acidimicrobiales bacterium]
MRRFSFSSVPSLFERSRRRALATAGVVGVASLALAGVGSSASTSASASTAKAFPITVTAANGSVRFASKPRRIISLSPTATDMLFAIGAGSQVIAVDSDSTYPKGAPVTSLSGLAPNVEAIATRNPDLVVISYAPSGLLPELAKLKIPVLEEPAASSLTDSYGQITALGRATGHSPNASDLVASMRSKIATYVTSAPKPAQPRTYYYELDQTYYSVTSRSFIGSILSKFGLTNIADPKGSSTAYPQLTAEYVVKRDPQIIFLADTVCCGQSKTTVAKRPGWSSIAAVKDHDVFALNDSVASQWGPRVTGLVAAVNAALVSMHARTQP